MQISKLQFKVQKYLKDFKFSTVFFSFLFFAFSLAMPTLAATLYLEPAVGEYMLGDTFLVEIRVNTEGEEINAIEANLKFPPDFLEFVDFSKGDSVLIFWPEEPQLIKEEGNFSFIGGVPGGFKGDGKILTLAFQSVSAGTAKIFFQDDLTVLLNDGKGTPAQLKTQEANFNISEEKREFPKDEWQEILKKDNVPPEPFQIELGKDPSIFDGKYFLAFYTTDIGSGIDYYEIREGDKSWKKGSSPYLLEDQSLRNKILVKAIDEAGNERIAEIIPPRKPFPWLIIILVLVILATMWLFRKKIINLFKERKKIREK